MNLLVRILILLSIAALVVALAMMLSGCFSASAKVEGVYQGSPIKADLNVTISK